MEIDNFLQEKNAFEELYQDSPENQNHQGGESWIDR